jgi:dTDP-4-amino-4,6-dideoxygalactose transaminase
MRRLREDGVGTQVHYYPVHRQPYYRGTVATPDLPGADRYYARCLSLPLFPAMADGDVDHVVSALMRAVGNGGGAG